MISRRWLAGDAVELAPQLLGKRIVAGALSGRIVEVEAYRQDDPASHSFAGETPRTRTMFGPPGHLYVYFTYGMHWCMNVVCGPEGYGAAILIRALEPLTGQSVMKSRRIKARRERDLCSGPAKLCQALGVDRSFDGVDLLHAESPIRLVDDGIAPPDQPGVGPRIGISKATQEPWRFFTVGSEHVSR